MDPACTKCASLWAVMQEDIEVTLCIYEHDPCVRGNLLNLLKTAYMAQGKDVRPLVDAENAMLVREGAH